MAMASPSFDAEALAALTKKIEAGLDQDKAQSRAHSTNLDRKKHKSTTSAPSLKSRAAPTKHETKKAERGRKRDSRGAIKETIYSKTEQKDGVTNHKGSHNSPGSQLLDEILALGGTKEDLSLVNDVGSDSEIAMEAGESHPKISTGERLQQDIVNFAKELGIQDHYTTADLFSSEAPEDEPIDVAVVSKPKQSKPVESTPVDQGARAKLQSKTGLVTGLVSYPSEFITIILIPV